MKHAQCRVCSATLPLPYLDLGDQPLANAFRSQRDVAETRYPLAVTRCSTCNLSQLTEVMDPTLLYEQYLYASGVSAAWRQHCEALAAEASPKGKLVLDIASNDGTLLRAFAAQGARVIGVDPAKTIEAPAEINTIQSFWDSSTARWVSARYGKADIVVAQNVFGHVNDARGFLFSIAKVMRDTGVCVIECPDVFKMLETLDFPQIYHEHLSYWSLVPLMTLAREVNLDVIAIKEIPTHGGSMRYYLKHRGAVIDPSVYYRLAFEGAYRKQGDAPYDTFRVQSRAQIESLKASVPPGTWGYGASAKATVLLNAADLSLAGVFDDSPLKQGRYIPGTGIEIHAPGTMAGIDTLLILAWNWGSELEAKARAWGFTGKFIYPLVAA